MSDKVLNKKIFKLREKNYLNYRSGFTVFFSFWLIFFGHKENKYIKNKNQIAPWQKEDLLKISRLAIKYLTKSKQWDLWIDFFFFKKKNMF